MKAPVMPLAVSAALLCAAAVGCGGGSSQPTQCFGANVIANESNNYRFTSKMTVPPVKVAQMSNLTFDWSTLSQDFLGHALAPATDLGMAMVMIWGLTRADFETALNLDMLYTADLVVSPPLNLPLTGATTGQLHNFLINGTAVSPAMFDAYFDASLYTPANSTFLVAVQTGADLGRQIRMLQSFELDAASTVTNVAVTNTSTKLSYSANLHNLTITGVPAATPALTLDWSQMMTNAHGTKFESNYITSAIVGHYAETPAELESKFLDLDRLAIKTYRGNIDAGTVLDFSTLTDETGAPFPGVSDDGTWLVGLICGICRNPAPWYMTILKPCSM